VPCSAEHLLQISGKVVLSDMSDFPADDFDSIVDSRCVALASQLIGRPL
jgi:hypothetical protein